MGNATGLTRGDKRRNERLARLRVVVPEQAAVVGIDLGEDTQMLVVTDPAGMLVNRRKEDAKAWGLGPALDWAIAQAAGKGLEQVTVAVEPTGNRWLHVQDLAAERGVQFVCVQPLATHLAREEEDYTRDKSDHKDAVLIARLARQRRCYGPEFSTGQWADLHHLGKRRAELIERSTAAKQQILDLLGLCWPTVLTAASEPLRAITWLASLTVALERVEGADFTRVRRLGVDRFLTLVRKQAVSWGGQKICRPIARRVFDALTDEVGVVQRGRAGALQRVAWALADLHQAHTQLQQVEQAMVEITTELDAAPLLATVPGLSPEAGAQILAEAGDPSRFTSARSLVKHAGLNPVENTSASFRGRTTGSKRGNPALRLAAWRATWGVVRHNEVLAARYRHLTTRQDNPLTATQAQAACAATLLRWIHAVLTGHVGWDPAIAGGARTPDLAPAA